MGLRSYFGIGAGREAEDRALTRQNVPPVMLSSTPGGSTVTPTNALAVADAYACVRALSDAAGSLPIHVYRRSDDGRERLDNRVSELLRNPAPAVTTANLIGQLVAHLQLHGNAYLGLFRDGQGRVSQLSLLAPDRVQPEIKAGKPSYTLTGPQGEQSRHGPEDIIHVKGMSTDGLMGLSPVRQCRVALGLSEQLGQHAERFFANDATPRGLLKVQQFGDSEAAVAALREGWNSEHAGTANAHRVAVVGGEIDFTPISMPLDDAQFLESRQWSSVEVARIFRLPPWVIGAPSGDSNTYSNVEQQALAFVTYSLRPILVTIEQALSASRELFTPNSYAEFALEGLLRGDSTTRASFYGAALDPITGWMSRAEVRRLENLPPEGEQTEIATPERLLAEAALAANANGNGEG